MDETETSIRIEIHDGPRDALRTLFGEADDSPTAIDSYLYQGRVLIAAGKEGIVGHLQLTETESPGSSRSRAWPYWHPTVAGA